MSQRPLGTSDKRKDLAAMLERAELFQEVSLKYHASTTESQPTKYLSVFKSTIEVRKISTIEET